MSVDPTRLRPGQRIRHSDGDEYILTERKTGADADPSPGWWLRKLEPPHRCGLADLAWLSGEWSVDGRPTDEPTEADPYPDGLPEDLYVDIESTIHQHCGHDGQSDEANDWVTDLMSALTPLIVRALVGGTEADPRRWRFSIEQVGGQQPTDYGTGTEDWAEWHWTLGTEGSVDVVLGGVEVEDPTSVLAEIVATLNGRALVGGRSAAPTRDEVREVAVDALKAAIDFDRDNPITADPEGFIAEQADRIVAAAGSSSSYVSSTGKGRAEPGISRQQLIRALDAEADGEDMIEVVHAADAIVALLSRSAAEPPEDDVLRGLLDHAVQSWSPRGTGHAPMLAEWDDADWADSGWTEAERVELRAAIARVAAEPNEKATDGDA